MATIHTQDLTELDEDQRAPFLDACVAATESAFKERYPQEDGYGHQHMTFQPFKEWPKLQGHHVKVHRGWFWGFIATLSPGDFQLRQIQVDLKRNFRFSEAVILVAVILGLLGSAAAVVLTFMETGWDMRALFIALFFGGAAAGFASFGILWVLSRPIIKAFADEASLSREETELTEKVIPTALGQKED